MYYRIKVIAIIAFAIVASLPAFSQVERVHEEDLDLGLLKWHYAKYPKSTEVQWIAIYLAEHKTIYKASFGYHGNQVLAIYNGEGTLVSERIEYDKNIPVSLIHYLDDLYSKYRIVSFVKSTNFQTDEISYTMEIRSKEKGDEVISFDKNLIPFDSYDLAGEAN